MEKLEDLLRPKTLDELVGQENIKAKLKVSINAAKNRHEALDHCLFYAPPGLGKTTLAHIIAKEMGGNLKMTSGHVLERIGDLSAILTNLSQGDIFFIDEIHRMNHLVEESLYPVMEDFELDIIIGQGPSAKTIKLPVPRFTLIGATTRAGLLSSSLRERFGIIEHLDFYTLDEMVKIVEHLAHIMNVSITKFAMQEIAKRSRSAPSIANRLLKRIRDYADEDNIITDCVVKDSLNILGIDDVGLDKTDRLILSAIIEKFNGGPVGASAIATVISKNAADISDIYEPYLVQLGFISLTPRGRIVTEAGRKHMNKELIGMNMSDVKLEEN